MAVKVTFCPEEKHTKGVDVRVWMWVCGCEGV